jgi:hypothetical protein
LLKHDRSRQRLKMGALGPQLDAAGAHDFDYAREDRIDTLEVSDRGAVVGHGENL